MLGLDLGIDHDRIAALVVECRRRAEGLRGQRHDLVHPALGQVAHVGVERADGALQAGHVRDDVMRLRIGLEGRDRDDDLLRRIDVAARDGLERDDDVAGHDRRVDRVMRLRGVAALALHLDQELVGRGEERAGADRELARG
jgi:hypothetical protein